MWPHTWEASESQQMLHPSNYVDNRGRIPVDFGMAPQALAPEKIDDFWLDMWEAGAGTGYICYYDRNYDDLNVV
jgi:hypothetical protein